MSEKMSAEELVELSHFVRFELDYDDRGYPAAKKLLAHIAAIQQEVEVMRLALNYALPIVEKYAHTQGDNAAFHAKITEPIRAALNGSPMETTMVEIYNEGDIPGDTIEGELSVERAYGLLWTVITDDARVHMARKLLLDVIGGQGSGRQRDGIQYWTNQAYVPASEDRDQDNG